MTEEKEKEKSGVISRREFLKDAGLVVGGAAIGSAVILAACKGAAETTETVTKTATVTGAPGGTVTVTGAPGGTKTVTTTATVTGAPGGTKTVTTTMTAGVAAAPTIKFSVNGYKYEMQVESNWTLQHLIHDRLGWTGVKDMCTGYGGCGSCTAIVDGRPILTCLALAEDFDGSVIETAEGVAKRNPKLMQAYDVNQCSQCGYCTPGFVVTVQALIDKKAKPTADEITEAIEGNLCRCGTYRQHILAVLEATGQS